MDIYKLVGGFWAEDQRAHFSGSATRLFFFLVNEANRRFWKGPLYLCWDFLQGTLGMQRDTLSRAISDLKSRGVITYEKVKGRAVFWFPAELLQLDNPTESPTVEVSQLDNPTKSPTRNPTENPTKNPTVYKDIRQEDSKTIRQKTKKENIRSPYGDLATSVAESSFRLDNPTKSDSNGKLSKVEQDVISTWETIVGPFDHTWIPLLRRALRACYPAQIKNAIVVLAKSKLEVMQEQGFEYVLEPLEKGAFGKRGNKKKMPKKFETKLAGLKEFLAEGDE